MSLPDHITPDTLDAALRNPYGYVPSKSVAIIMLALFGISTLLHTGQSIYHRKWFLLITAVLCGVGEILGWAARLWSHSEPYTTVAFQIQITCTIIAPTPLLAATFVIFGAITGRLGTSYSRLSPRLYTIIFCTCDVVSLVVQALGGGLAAVADEENGMDPELGGNIMLGGIAFQLAVITIFSICALEYSIRYILDKPLRSRSQKSADGGLRGEFTRNLQIMLGALGFSTVVLFIRAVYRTIELVDGWNGRIITTELYFNVLDGAMVVLAMYTINIFHPGCLVYSRPTLVEGLAEPKETPTSERSTLSTGSLA